MDGAPKLAGNTWPGGAPGADSIIPVGPALGRVSRLIAARLEKQSCHLRIKVLGSMARSPNPPIPSLRRSNMFTVA